MRGPLRHAASEEPIALPPLATERVFCHLPLLPMTLTIQEPLAPPISTAEIAPAPISLHSERHQLLQKIRDVLDGWYHRGAMSISIDGVATFGTEDQCIEILERARTSEIQHVYRLLRGDR